MTYRPLQIISAAANRVILLAESALPLCSLILCFTPGLYCFLLPNSPPNAFAGFCFTTFFPNPIAFCATPPTIPPTSGTKRGFAVVPSIAKGTPPLPLPAAATCDLLRSYLSASFGFSRKA
jgi:hypothetical protein